MAEKTKVTTPVGRAAFVTLNEPRAFEPGKTPKYDITLLFPPGTDLSALENEIRTKAQAKWPNGIPANFHMPIKDTANKDAFAATFPGWKYMKVSSTRAPGIVGPDGRLRIDAADSEGVYSGCWARATCYGYAYEHSMGGKGVTMTLEHVQKVRDDEKLAGSSPEGAFDAVETEAWTGTAPNPADFFKS